MTSDTENLASRLRRCAASTIVAVVAVAGCAGAPGATDEGASTDSIEHPPVPADGLAITVERVSDGDSIRATSTEGDLEIRLIGINSPEGDECFGAESSTALADLVDAGDALLSPWPPERDDFGRELGFVWVGDRLVNLALLETGHAVARAQSDHRFAADFERAETRAASDGVGLWAADACGPPATAELTIVDVLDDAPGDDRANPNGEWVLIRNDGAAAADLAGWVLRDESTRHRYDFPSITLLPGDEARIRSGCGDDDLDESPLELYWCDPGPPIWNNGGDTAFLLDPSGNIADHFRT